MFGQHARQPAFNHGNWEKKNLGESPAAEKYQTLQAARQVAWQNVAHQQQMNFKIYEYQSASHEFKPEQWVLMKDNRNQWGGPFQIVKIKPHNTVEIKTGFKNQKETEGNFAEVKRISMEYLKSEGLIPQSRIDLRDYSKTKVHKFSVSNLVFKDYSLQNIFCSCW